MSDPKDIPSDLAGTDLGPYHLVERIGAGGSGTVYRARKRGDSDLVALKVSPPQDDENRVSTARFLREVQAIRRIDHDGCVQLVDWGIDRSRVFIAMRLVHGEVLSDSLSKVGKFDAIRAVEVAIEVCDVLEHAHGLGVVHRDLKPSNIMLVQDGERERVKVLDFGLAKLFRTEMLQHESDSMDHETHVVTLTSPSTVLGTPKYMAPEQVGGQADVDGRTDLYAVGVLLYRMLTGRLPYEGRDALTWLMNLTTTEPKRPLAMVRSLPPKLDALVMQCMEKDSADRPASATEVKRLLIDVLDELKKVVHEKPTDVIRRPGATLEEASTESVTTPPFERGKRKRFLPGEGEEVTTEEAKTRPLVKIAPYEIGDYEEDDTHELTQPEKTRVLRRRLSEPKSRRKRQREPRQLSSDGITVEMPAPNADEDEGETKVVSEDPGPAQRRDMLLTAISLLIIALVIVWQLWK